MFPDKTPFNVHQTVQKSQVNPKELTKKYKTTDKHQRHITKALPIRTSQQHDSLRPPWRYK